MFTSILRDRKLLILFLLALLIKLFSLDDTRVEEYYTYGFYPYFSGLLRALLGWLPFSVGDLVYLGAFVLLVLKAWKALRLLARRQVKEYLSHVLFRKYLRLVLWIYIIFQVFWGLNYSRQGVAQQFGLEVRPYNAQDLYDLTATLQVKLNQYAAAVDTLRREAIHRDNSLLFREGVRAYERAAQQYPFLAYRQPSVKASFYSPVGHLFGFTGYYNPFSGEAQMRTSVPVFVKPFILCHEIGHQLGYAKENEANFIAFLSGRESDHPEFRYSAYYDVYAYAARELIRYDTTLYASLRKTVHPRFRTDHNAYMAFLYRSRNPVEPLMSDFYDRYLRLNNQPSGKRSYNEVVAWLVAYMKKYGRSAI